MLHLLWVLKVLCTCLEPVKICMGDLSWPKCVGMLGWFKCLGMLGWLELAYPTTVVVVLS